MKSREFPVADGRFGQGPVLEQCIEASDRITMGANFAASSSMVVIQRAARAFRTEYTFHK